MNCADAPSKWQGPHGPLRVGLRVAGEWLRGWTGFTSTRRRRRSALLRCFLIQSVSAGVMSVHFSLALSTLHLSTLAVGMALNINT